MPEVAERAAAVPAGTLPCSPSATVRKPLPLPVVVARVVSDGRQGPGVCRGALVDVVAEHRGPGAADRRGGCGVRAGGGRAFGPARRRRGSPAPLYASRARLTLDVASSVTWRLAPPVPATATRVSTQERISVPSETVPRSGPARRGGERRGPGGRDEEQQPVAGLHGRRDEHDRVPGVGVRGGARPPLRPDRWRRLVLGDDLVRHDVGGALVVGDREGHGVGAECRRTRDRWSRSSPSPSRRRRSPSRSSPARRRRGRWSRSR